MLVVDAACLFEVVTGGPHSETIRERMEVDSDHVAPHIVDVEVFGVIRQKFLAGQLDRTLAAQAVQDTASWVVNGLIIVRFSIGRGRYGTRCVAGTRCTSRSPKRWTPP